MDWAHLDSEQENRLHQLIGFYMREGRKCRKAKAHLPACIMFGAALETLLILTVAAFSEEIPHDILPKKKQVPKVLLDWDLHELLVIARECGWLPAGLKFDEDWDHKRANIGDQTYVIKMMRNLVHPARVIDELGSSRVTNRHSRFAADVFEAAVIHLEAKIHDFFLARQMAEEQQFGES